MYGTHCLCDFCIKFDIADYFSIFICVSRKIVVTLHAFSGVLCPCVGAEDEKATIIINVELGSGFASRRRSGDKAVGRCET